MQFRFRWIVIGLAVLAVSLVAAYFTLERVVEARTLTVVKKVSPDDRHTAKLVTRQAGLDVNIYVDLDGSRIYTSPDFAAPAKVDFQERLAWDRSSTILMLEVAGERLFGYNVRQNRTLTPMELLQVKLPPFSDVAFTDSLPREIAAGQR